MTTLREVKNGEFFRLKENGKTYIKQAGDYDKASKTFCCSNYEDINDFRNFKPTQKVIIGFTY